MFGKLGEARPVATKTICVEVVHLWNAERRNFERVVPATMDDAEVIHSVWECNGFNHLTHRLGECTVEQ